MQKEIVKTQKLESGRFEATLITYIQKDGYYLIYSKEVRTASSEELAIDGVKKASMLNKLW